MLDYLCVPSWSTSAGVTDVSPYLASYLGLGIIPTLSESKHSLSLSLAQMHSPGMSGKGFTHKPTSPAFCLEILNKCLYESPVFLFCTQSHRVMLPGPLKTFKKNWRLSLPEACHWLLVGRVQDAAKALYPEDCPQYKGLWKCQLCQCWETPN